MLDFNQKGNRVAKNWINISGKGGNCPKHTQPKGSDVEFDIIGWYCRTKRMQKGMNFQLLRETPDEENSRV